MDRHVYKRRPGDEWFAAQSVRTAVHKPIQKTSTFTLMWQEFRQIPLVELRAVHKCTFVLSAVCHCDSFFSQSGCIGK